MTTMDGGRETDGMLVFPVGKAADGRGIWSDFGRVPHILVAGMGGSGKTTFIRSLISTIAQEHSPEEVRFLLADSYCVELEEFASLPHLLSPIAHDSVQVENALQWAVSRMKARLEWFSLAGCTDIGSFMAKTRTKLASVVLVIDDFSELMGQTGETIESPVLSLASEGAAAGFHLVLVAKRICVNTLTGAILSAFPGRLVFKVISRADSKHLLGTDEAQKLDWRGDGIWCEPTAERLRVLWRFTPREEVARIVANIAARCPHTTVLGPWARVEEEEEPLAATFFDCRNRSVVYEGKRDSADERKGGDKPVATEVARQPQRCVVADGVAGGKRSRRPRSESCTA